MTEKSWKDKIEIFKEILALDPNAIDFSDKELVKSLFFKYLNVTETLLQENLKLKEYVQLLEDEINRLKGEKGMPKIKPNVPNKENNVGGQIKPKPWKKESKNNRIKIDREEYRQVDRNILPPDAVHKGYRSVTIQNIKLTTDNVRYMLERFFSPQAGKLYEASLPEGIQGEFGSELKAFIHFLYFKGRVTENRIHGLLRDIGITISEGQISDILTNSNSEAFTKEKQEVFEEGMKHAGYFNIDDTGARHRGMNNRFHAISTELFTAFFIMPRKDRETVEHILDLSGTNWRSKIMISDNARQFQGLTKIQALCWIHEFRHYRKLSPMLEYYKNILHEFLTEAWEYYHQLDEYRKAPKRRRRKYLEQRFDELFSRETAYAELNWRMQQTMGNKDRLLVVLDYPDIPLHNNSVEIAVREPVVKKNISYGTRSEAGKRVWENMLSLSDTCRKLGISFYAYLNDRFSGRNEIPLLGKIIAEKAAICS